MKYKIIAFILVVVSATSISFLAFTQQPEPWRPDQLLNPADLAATISDKAASQPVIVSVGPGAAIPKSIEVGPAHDPANLKKLETELSGLSKDSEIVLYCG